MAKSTVLIVGLGQIGMGYDLTLSPAMNVYSHARAFSVHESFDLIGGVDPDADRRNTFESEYRLPAFTSLGDALQAQKPAVVVIAGPTSMHGAIVRQLISAHPPLAILCEKPLSHDLAEAEEIVSLCADAGVQLYVNYMRRADPGVVEVKRRLMAGEIGLPARGIVWYSKGFVHNGSHLFNLLEYWLGPMQRFDMVEAGRMWNGVDPEPDVRVEFKDGTITFVAAREEDFSHYTVELVSSTGRLRYEQGGRSIQWQPATPDPFYQGYTVLSEHAEIVPSGRNRSQWHVAEQLAAAIGGNGFHLCTGQDAFATLKSVNQIIGKR